MQKAKAMTKRALSLLLCAAMVMSFAYTRFADLVVSAADTLVPTMESTSYNSAAPTNQNKVIVADGSSRMEMTSDKLGLAFRYTISADGISVKDSTVADLTNATILVNGNQHKLVSMGAILTNDEAVGAKGMTLADVDNKKVLAINAKYLCALEDHSASYAVRITNIPLANKSSLIYARAYYVIASEIEGETVETIFYDDIQAANYSEQYDEKFVYIGEMEYTETNIVTLGELFTGTNVKDDKVEVSVVGAATYVPDSENWKNGTITFTGAGDVTITITDNFVCVPTEVTVTVNELGAGDKITAPVTPDDGKVPAGGITLTGDSVSAYIPAGVALKDGVTSLTLTVTLLKDTQSGITAGDDEVLIPVDVHIDGIAEDNTVPIIIDLGEVLPKSLNMGNYHLFHVENNGTNAMTLVDSRDELTAHNTFTYDPNTGAVSIAMCTFSEVALVADTENAWNGEFDYTWYDASKSVLNIANADQLAAFGAIVGGMAEGIEQNSFSGKTVKLLADINLGDKESENNEDLIFYPIGYWNNEGTYERKPLEERTTAVESGLYSFCGTFDGNGHTIANFYHNTWEMKGDHNWYDPIKEQYYRDGMGLFGRVYGGTVKNLTVSNFTSDGEIATTGVIAAYADGATFENIAITNCNPRVYNIGNGGIVGCVGWYAKEANLKTTFKNITVDNSNKISALWGSYDVACGGIVGQYYPTSGQSSVGNPVNGGIELVNCHVSAQMDVYNDVCGNYQYYAYRYAGMLIGSIRENTTNDDGKVIPNMMGISATSCTVNYGDWNDYYYCEFEKNGHPSYSGPDDYKFSRVDKSEIIFDENGNAIGCTHNHSDVEDNRAIYLPFHQLFTGYSWGVTSIGLEKYSGVVTDQDISEGEQQESVVKFESKFTGDFLYRVGNQNTVSVGSLFAVKNEYAEGSNHQLEVKKNSSVYVTIDKVDEDANVSGTFTANTTDWTKGTIQFSGTGVVKITIQDYNFCTPTVLYVEVVDAMNATSAMSTNNGKTGNERKEYNVVLLNDCGLSSLTVDGRYAFYGNGFTMTYSGNGQYLNNGLKMGVVTVSENGILDNVRIVATVYPRAYMYYGTTLLGDYVQGGPSSVEGEKTRYHYQLSAVVAKGNATIQNCYIYGGRNNIFVDTGDVTIKDTVLECGTVANVQIQSNSDYTVTFDNLTTIQKKVNPTIGDTSKVILGSAIIVGPDDNPSNPTIVLNGSLKQYNWVNETDENDVSDSLAKKIIGAAVDATAYNHTINGKTASNLGIIYMNQEPCTIKNNTGMPYFGEPLSLSGANGYVYSLQNATEDQIYSDVENADRTTVNGLYQPQFKYDATLGGQYIKDNGGDEFCYREGDTIKIMFPTGDTKTLDLASLVNIAKYSGQDLNLEVSGDGVSDGKITLSAAGDYVITYTVTDTVFYDKDGKTVAKSITYSWDVTLNVSLKDTKVPNAYYEFDPSKQKMGYYKKSGLTGTSIYQYIPFLAGLKIYDHNGQEPYLRFDGDTDFNKVASITVTNKHSGNDALVVVKLTDDGTITLQLLARADSGGGSTYTGSIKTSNNVIYFVNDGTTSDKDTTTTAAHWYVDYYKFTGNNGVEITSDPQKFTSTGSSASTPSGSFNTSIKYTVTYDANGGNCVQSSSYATSVATAVILPTPIRSGYIFAGWYTAASGGTRVGGAGDNYTPTANVTLYAQWADPFDVTFNYGTGTVETQTYRGTPLTLPNANNGDKVLKGWFTAASGGTYIGGAGDKYIPTTATTLYAQWQNVATVTYNATENGGSCSTTTATFNGTALILPTPDSRTGYIFNGWYTAASGGTKVGDAGAKYSPENNITLYAQWEMPTYTITIGTKSNATVTVDKTSAYEGDTVSVTVSFSQSNNRSLTVKDASGNTILSKSAEGTYTFTMPASNVTISASSEKSCVTADTLVTLADGSMKRIDEITYEDQLLVWNFFTGEYDTVPSAIIFYHGDDIYRVLNLHFEDGTTVKVINNHGFFDVEANKFVFIEEANVAEYIGHNFVKVDGDGYVNVKLVGYSITEEYTGCYSIQTAVHINFMTEGMFSETTPPFDGWFDYFEIGDNMKYDEAKMQADIEKYGLFTYEEFADMVTYEQFIAFNGPYLKVLIGRGVVTFDEIIKLISTYVNP